MKEEPLVWIRSVVRLYQWSYIPGEGKSAEGNLTLHGINHCTWWWNRKRIITTGVIYFGTTYVDLFYILIIFYISILFNFFIFSNFLFTIRCTINFNIAAHEHILIQFTICLSVMSTILIQYFESGDFTLLAMLAAYLIYISVSKH